LANLREKIDARQIKLSYQLPPGKLPLISGDREKIEIAMQNLLENAINYSSDGGQVIVKVEGDKKQLVFKVVDNGIGIADGQKERIFGKFFRGDNAMKKDTQGSGLGLFMCKNIIESHGGQVGFESTAGQGSTFFFSLPIKAMIKEERLKITAEEKQSAVDKPVKESKIKIDKKNK
jgi:signal transduction histidine kinase